MMKIQAEMNGTWRLKTKKMRMKTTKMNTWIVMMISPTAISRKTLKILQTTYLH
jgi:hypothetical protein